MCSENCAKYHFNQINEQKFVLIVQDVALWHNNFLRLHLLHLRNDAILLELQCTVLCYRTDFETITDLIAWFHFNGFESLNRVEIDFRRRSQKYCFFWLLSKMEKQQFFIWLLKIEYTPWFESNSWLKYISRSDTYPKKEKKETQNEQIEEQYTTNWKVFQLPHFKLSNRFVRDVQRIAWKIVIHIPPISFVCKYYMFFAASNEIESCMCRCQYCSRAWWKKKTGNQ